jgi:hypothetical protein
MHPTFELVPGNAPGSRNVIESISWRQSTRAIGRHIGPKPFGGLPPNFVHDKGRYRQDSVTGAPRTFQALSLATEIPSRSFTAS